MYVFDKVLIIITEYAYEIATFVLLLISAGLWRTRAHRKRRQKCFWSTFLFQQSLREGFGELDYQCTPSPRKFRKGSIYGFAGWLLISPFNFHYYMIPRPYHVRPGWQLLPLKRPGGIGPPIFVHQNGPQIETAELCRVALLVVCRLVCAQWKLHMHLLGSC